MQPRSLGQARGRGHMRLSFTLASVCESEQKLACKHMHVTSTIKLAPVIDGWMDGWMAIWTVKMEFSTGLWGLLCTHAGAFIFGLSWHM